MNIKFLIVIICANFLSILEAEIDPFKDINEKTHQLNQRLDESIATPVARFYKKVTPDILETGITNFTDNIEDINIAANNILQGKIKSGISDIFRFTLNSSIGLLGFFDVASKIGLEKHSEDFGQTLAVWGIDEGPYIVLPLLGPSSLRDTVARIPEAFMTPLILIDHDRTGYELTAIDLLEKRARYLGLESIVIGDEYLFYRDAYFQSREFEINDGLVEDDFDDFNYDD
ncbi:MAG: hypothetical protein CMD53_00370 [Gammaproteobacteria bacterium]|nr:hypothetical protein [Gammaproteobacteria bacterium]